MKILSASAITDAVAELCIHANRFLPKDVRERMESCAAGETSACAREVFRQLKENWILAAETGLPLCQDTGLAVFFIDVGQDVHIKGDMREAVNEGVRRGYGAGFLRKSVCEPFTRKNTGDNTPAIIHTTLVPGDTVRIRYMAKGGGSENMSRVTMLAPAQGWDGIREFVIRRVAESGSNPCPPVIVGLGVGGSFDYAPILAKQALFRPLDDVNPDPDLAEKEEELLCALNRLHIGPMGLGGVTTCLAVKIAKAPCHIASLPLAVNIQCHSARHEEVVL